MFCVLVAPGLEDVHPAAAGALPGVHGRVGVAQQVRRRDRRVRRGDDDADGRRDVHRGVVDRGGLGHRVEETARQRAGLVLVGVLADDRELVVTAAGDGLVAGHGRPQARADLGQHQVTDVVPP